MNIEKLCILVPVYNNPGTIRRVVDDIRQVCDLTIFVIDDGSDIPVSELIDSSHKDVVCILHSENQGKGVALRTGAQKAKEAGFEHCITMDADGQHFADDIEKFVQIYQEEFDPEVMVIGVRDFETCTPPKSSIIGRRIGNFWVWIESGVHVSDTQTGFRLYPLSMLAYRSFTRRYEFEIENLVRFIWSGGKLRETSVKTIYDESRITHFHKLKDNGFMILLHTKLVIQRLLLLKGIFR